MIPHVEELKQSLPNVKPFKTLNHKFIQQELRAPRSIYKDHGVPPARTVAFIQEIYKYLGCEPKAQGSGKRKEAQRFDLAMKHIDLKAAGATSGSIRALMEDLERQFMEDPRFQIAEELTGQGPPAASTGGALAGDGEGQPAAKLGSSSQRGSPGRSGATGGAGDVSVMACYLGIKAINSRCCIEEQESCSVCEAEGRS